MLFDMTASKSSSISSRYLGSKQEYSIKTDHVSKNPSFS